MTLQEKIAHDVIEALKSGDSHRRSTLGMLRAAIHNRAIERGAQETGLSDAEVLTVVSSEAKKRTDAIAAYEQAGKSERAEEERKELEILREYLPEQLDREAVTREIAALVDEAGDVGPDDTGRLMGQAMQRLKGRADGTMVREVLEETLNKRVG